MVDWFKLGVAGYFMLTVGFAAAGHAIASLDGSNSAGIKAALVCGSLWPLAMVLAGVVLALVPLGMAFIIVAVVLMLPAWMMQAWRGKYQGPKMPGSKEKEGDE